MTEHAEMGKNRTGISTSPKLTQEMVAGTAEFPPDLPGDERQIATERSLRTKSGSTLGSVPPPPTVKGMLKSALTAVKGESPTQFIDKMAERLAFERTGTRLYEALLSKFDASGGFAGGPTRVELQRILEDEFSHFRMLEESVAKIGADPTVITPSADMHATMTKGVLEVMVDPRTNFAQCLEAILVAELVDNDGWEALTTMAEQAGQRDLATRFQRALAEEQGHLVNVRRWLAIAQGRLAP